MTTAPENRGGIRPTAPQNNPANVSGTGGAGQSGNYSGFAYGMNKQLNEQRVSGNAAAAAAAPTGSEPVPMQLPNVTPITAGTENPDESIFNGAPVGDGMNTIPGLPGNQDADVDKQRLYHIFQHLKQRLKAQTLHKHFVTM